MFSSDKGAGNPRFQQGLIAGRVVVMAVAAYGVVCRQGIDPQPVGILQKFRAGSQITQYGFSMSFNEKGKPVSVDHCAVSAGVIIN